MTNDEAGNEVTIEWTDDLNPGAGVYSKLFTDWLMAVQLLRAIAQIEGLRILAIKASEEFFVYDRAFK